MIFEKEKNQSTNSTFEAIETQTHLVPNPSNPSIKSLLPVPTQNKAYYTSKTIGAASTL